jgi:hypothetical protein
MYCPTTKQYRLLYHYFHIKFDTYDLIPNLLKFFKKYVISIFSMNK